MGKSGRTPVLAVREVSPWSEFVGDVKAAALAWGRAPMLPVLTMLIAGVTGVGLQGSYGGGLKLAVEVLYFFTLGFFGTQRIWYLRVFRGQHLTLREAWSLTWKFVGRFLVLGLLTGLPLIVFYVIYASVYVVPNARRGALLHRPLLWYVIPVAFTIGLDFMLTFVTPALAYSTRSAVEALQFGLKMIRTTWPSALFYVFFPPLALQVLVLQPERVIGDPRVWVLGTAFAALISLLFKGAVAAFYLRYVDGIGDDGAADAVPLRLSI